MTLNKTVIGFRLKKIAFDWLFTNSINKILLREFAIRMCDSAFCRMMGIIWFCICVVTLSWYTRVACFTIIDPNGFGIHAGKWALERADQAAFGVIISCDRRKRATHESSMKKTTRLKFGARFRGKISGNWLYRTLKHRPKSKCQVKWIFAKTRA